jgi:hypothetical protein
MHLPAQVPLARLRLPALRGPSLLAAVTAAVLTVLALSRTLHLDTPLGFAIDPAVLS